MAQWPGFCGPSYVSQSSVILGERCINLYPQPIEGAGKTRMALYPTPNVGGDSWDLSTGGGTKCLALFAPGILNTAGVTRAFAATDTSFLELLAGGGTATVLGTFQSSDGTVSIAYNGINGHQIAITSDRRLYIYDVSAGTFTGPISDTGGNAIQTTQILFLDGYFVSMDSAASVQTFQISALFDGTTWDPLDVAQSTASSDLWVRMSKSDRTIWFIGMQTAQPWYNNGDPDFPFAPFEGAFVETGCVAPASVVRIGQEYSGPIFLSTSDSGGYSFRHLNGYTPERISNEGVEYVLSTYRTVKDAIAFTYADQGQNFYVCVFPSENACWAWASHGGWHERLEWTNGEWRASDIASHCFAFGEHIFGSRTQAIATSSRVANTSNLLGTNTRRVRRTPVLSKEGGRIKVPRITLDMEAGLGLSTATATQSAMSAATVSLSLSRDGGKTWGTQRPKSLGALGHYDQRIYWDMNGSGRAVVAEIEMSDPSPYRIANAYLGQPT